MTFSILSPKVDFIFKKIFGSEENKSVLISFLNAVLYDDNNSISSVELKNTDIEKEYIRDKHSRLDIKAITNNNEIVNIEIQLSNTYNMTKRTLYYWSKLFEEQIEESEDYSKLNKTICINILDFNYLKNEYNFHNVYRLQNIHNKNELTDICEIHFIEIPKLKKLNINESNKMIEVWTEFLRNPESEIIRDFEFKNKDVKKAKDKLCKISQNKKEREIYFIRDKMKKDEISALSFAEKKGIEKGIEKGIKKGIEKGRKERDTEIAKKLIENGLDDSLIASTTGLSIETIKQLRLK